MKMLAAYANLPTCISKACGTAGFKNFKTKQITSSKCLHIEDLYF